MKAKCFGCDAIIEAVSADDVCDAFIAHATSAHGWSYPEQALRNYARNCAEAPARLTGDTERRAGIGAIVIHPVTEDRIADWVRFFDHDAFAGHPDFASCYCLEPNVPATPELPERAWRDTRAATTTRLRNCSTFGYLAYVDGQAAGWVNASMRSDCGLYRNVDPRGPDARSVVAVSCFVVSPPFRRHGVAAALLDRVIADAAARGADWVEGYPHNDPEGGDPGHFRGPRSMYDVRGFVPVEVRERDTVLRRNVG